MYLGNYLFLLFYFINLILDLRSSRTVECIKNHKSVLFILILHHLFDTFCFFGWLLSPLLFLKLYLVIISVLLLYLFYNRYCHVTRLVNNICGWNRYDLFNDIFLKLGMKDKGIGPVKYYYIFMFMGILIALFRVFL